MYRGVNNEKRYLYEVSTIHENEKNRQREKKYIRETRISFLHERWLRRCGHYFETVNQG